MTVWVLIFYMSVGWGHGKTGGPGVIDGFQSQEACVAAYKTMQQDPKFKDWLDYGSCVKVTK